jgi:hypothetical protein
MKIPFAILLTVWLASPDARGATIAINFDTDPNGLPITAPSAFSETKHLSELYASLGVHFGGPGDLDGGAILHQDSNFGVNARSGLRFLAFNRGAVMADGGVPRDPEKIRFDVLMSDLSVFVAGGGIVRTFVIEAFDANGNLVDSDTVKTQAFSQLQVASPIGIRSVTLSVTEAGNHVAFVVDDLSGHTIPEPAGALLIGMASLLAGRLRTTGSRHR